MRPIKNQPRRLSLQWIGAAVLVLLIALTGIQLVRLSQAATPFVSAEPELGTLNSPSTAVNDSTASGSKSVQFKNPATGPPSGVPMPIGDVTSGGHTWRQIVAEDFTKDAALGSWGSDCDGTKIVYTGATGTNWRSYPKCYLDTYQKRPYRADQVLSVHNGVLDFWLHVVDGKPAGANPSPILPGGSQYQTYGRYEVRFRTTTINLPEYYTAFLLWPQDEAKWQCAESDYPESKLNTTSYSAFAHYCRSDGTGTQDHYSVTLDRTQWHTYTQEWIPGKRNYYLDGTLIGSSTNNIFGSLERWQLQTETNTTCDQVTPTTCSPGGNLLIDWATVYAY